MHINATLATLLISRVGECEIVLSTLHHWISVISIQNAYVVIEPSLNG